VNLIIIDDNKLFADSLRKDLTDKNKIEFDTTKDPRDISQDIANYLFDKTFENNLLHIFINIEGHFSNSKRQEQKGIEILLWLRCKHKISNPVILYSFQSNHDLLKQKPEQLIINSEGCYYFQLPYNFSKIKNHSLRGVTDWKGIKKFLKTDDSIELFRHQEANWWGVKQLCEIYRAMDYNLNFDIENSFPQRYEKYYPHLINKKLEDVNNFVIAFKHEKSLNSISEAIIDSSVEQKKKRIIELQEEIDIKKLKKDFDKATVGQKLWHFNEVLKITTDKEIRDKCIYDLLKIKEKLNQIKNNIASLLNEIEQLKNIKDLHSAEQSIYRTLIEKFEIRNNIKTVHIDDQASEGWSDIFQHMIYGKISTSKFKSLPITSVNFKLQDFESCINELMKVFNELISSTNNGVGFYPDLILLDVRLFPQYDNSKGNSIQNMSGARILKEIRKKYPGIPIIITTASNKMQTYEELLRLGADAYWVKEGLDEKKSTEESVKNYNRFIELVANLTGDEYIFIKKITNEIREIFHKKEGKKFWWEEIDWKYEYIYKDKFDNSYTIIPRTTIADRETIQGILHDAVALMRQYCQTTKLGIGHNSWANTSWYLASQVIQHLSNIIEFIHNFGLIRQNYKALQLQGDIGFKEFDTRGTIYGYNYRNKFIFRRKDSKGSELYKIRNEAAHYYTAHELTFDKDLKKFFNKILKYLVNEPKVNQPVTIHIEKQGVVYDSNGKII